VAGLPAPPAQARSQWNTTTRRARPGNVFDAACSVVVNQ
jgi:hypothetical protein